jgi:drug/metabolite transporter (DMT)-like permease
MRIIFLSILSFIGITLVVNPALLGFSSLVSEQQQAGGLFMKFLALVSGLGGAAITIFLSFFAKSLHPA